MRFSVSENHGLKSHLKTWLLPAGRSPRRLPLGLLAGLTMELDFAHQSQRWLGLQERELFGWMRRLSMGIRTAVDVGANDGMYTLYFLSSTPAKHVVAFEPSPESLADLNTNLALNQLSHDARLEVVTQKVGCVVDEEWTTLDSLLPSIEIPCLVKVDIDGGEVDMLGGAQKLLLSADVRWIIEIHSKALERDCLRILRDAGYQTHVVPNAWWRHIVPELRPGEANHWLVAFREETAKAGRA